jgi:integral membrane protein (TIGR00529 family)
MLQLLLLFLLIIVLIRFKIPIGFSLLSGALLLGIWNYGLGNDLWLLLYQSFINVQSWKLVITVALILTFANLFESAGFVKSLVSSLESFLSPRWVGRAAPAIIGLLPMPGGAMVSAPIVKEIGRDTDAKPEVFTAANYWWRHVWEATWPLYPSIILAAAVLKISVWDVAIINFPISVTCIATGLLLGKIGDSQKSGARIDLLLLLRSLWPILFIVLLGLVLKVDLILSVAIVILILIFSYHIRLSAVKKAFLKSFSPNIIILIFGVMTLMYTMETTGTAGLFYEELLQINIAPALVVFAVPFVVGVLTGVTSAYIGVGFPVILPLLGTGSLTFEAGMLLAFAGGFMGVMASPVHLCLVLTREYFGASLGKTMTLLILPIALTSCISWALASILYG